MSDCVVVLRWGSQDSKTFLTGAVLTFGMYCLSVRVSVEANIQAQQAHTPTWLGRSKELEPGGRFRIHASEDVHLERAAERRTRIDVELDVGNEN